MKKRLNTILLLLTFICASSMASEQLVLNEDARETYCSIILEEAKKLNLISYPKTQCLKHTWSFSADESYEPFPSSSQSYDVYFSEWEISELKNYEQKLICDFDVEVFNKKVIIKSFICDLEG